MAEDARAPRPWVSINMAASVDGKITSAAREYPRMTSRADRLNMDRLRAESDAVLVGAGTLRADRPSLHVRSPEMQRHRAEIGRPPGLLKIVVSSSGRIDPGLLKDADSGGWIVATTEEAAQPEGGWPRGVEVWRIGRDRVDLPTLLERLRARGVERLLVEGGGDLNWAFFEKDLVDELHVTVAPVLLGGRDAPTLLEGQGLAMAQQRKLRLGELRREGDELYCRWDVVR